MAVDWATLEDLQRRLGRASARLEKCAGSAPGPVDAGVMTEVVAWLVARVTDSAAGLSEGLGAAGVQVVDHTTDLWEVEDAVDDLFTLMRRAGLQGVG